MEHSQYVTRITTCKIFRNLLLRSSEFQPGHVQLVKTKVSPTRTRQLWHFPRLPRNCFQSISRKNQLQELKEQLSMTLGRHASKVRLCGTAGTEIKEYRFTTGQAIWKVEAAATLVIKKSIIWFINSVQSVLFQAKCDCACFCCICCLRTILNFC